MAQLKEKEIVMSKPSLLTLRRFVPPPRTTRFRLKTVDLDGPVAYADFGGEGPTLVLVHGLGGNHLNWLPAAPMLAKHARVLAVDLVGFGRTPAAGRGFGLDAQRTMLERFLDDVAGTPSVVVGNSMGGTLALSLAASAPDLVAGAVMVSAALPPPKGASFSFEIIRRSLVQALPGVGELAMYWNGRRQGARGLFLDLLTLGTKDVRRVPPEVVEANVSIIADRMQKSPLGHAQSYLQASRSLFFQLMTPGLVEGWARQVRSPVLLMHGAEDRLVPPACSTELHEMRPDFDLEIFDDAGHVPQMEDAARFTERLVAWLAAQRSRWVPPEDQVRMAS